MKKPKSIILLAFACIAMGAVWGGATVKYKLFPYSQIVAAAEYKSPQIEARRVYLSERTAPARLAFVGDSIFQSIEWSEEFPGAINRGIQSDSTLDVIKRLPSLKPIDADTYVIMLGVNDLALGRDAADISESIRLITEALPGRKIVMSVTPCDPSYSDCDQSKVAQVNNRLKKLTGVTFVQSDLSPATDLYDMVHPNTHGIKKLVDAVRPHVEI